MQLFRRVTIAEAERTLKNGFEDYEVTSKNQRLSGVWVCNKSLACHYFEYTAPEILLKIDLALPRSAIFDFERIEKDKWFREWIVPSELLNAHAKVSVVDEGDGPPMPPPL